MRAGFAALVLVCLMLRRLTRIRASSSSNSAMCRRRKRTRSRAAEHFKQLAEKLTQGRVRIELFPNSQLYKDKEELEALQLGAVQMLAPSVSKFGPLGIKEFEVFDLPYLFSTYEDVAKVTEGPIGAELLEKLEGQGHHRARATGTTGSRFSRRTSR